MRDSTIASSTAAILFAFLATLPAADQSRPTTVVGVKLMKSAPTAAGGTFRVKMPAQCGTCSLIADPAYHGENPREIYFHVRVPADAGVIRDFRVELGGVLIRAVIVEKARIPFAALADAVTFDLPVAPRARSSTVEVQTSLQWPGIVLRIEHAFSDRRAGKYASGEFPTVQRGAALNLEFGLREAIRELHLDRDVFSRGLGQIHLMGFDTNNPLGHEDFPPHIHLILRWPHFAGSQAPHYYISGRGLLLPEVSVTIDGMPHIAATKIGPGAWLPAIDSLGESLYETQVTPGGGLSLRRPGGPSCELHPLAPGDGGFASGATVDCSGGAVYRVEAADDTDLGVVTVRVNILKPETWRYDVDTAVLLSPQPHP